ncbi:ABC transporter ATP-binding protein [Roseicella sp. DB1501]|uniref:ABC transporter ATP-binding protein n=1 Tax=Roseicella sp. DB1501 TaxID=2730925 RepID=UPI001491C5E4|nr:ABC transporter ATP-binding protein [Roseicella sp. DB1501]NOG73313.1 ABC transporter ATP-binding protein [Roseicella sp. DB1501]
MDDLAALPVQPATAAVPILDIQGVGKRFAFGAETITALSGATLRIPKGQFVCLIGPSGCGKSTLLRMIAGFETASEGTLLMAGRHVAGPGPDRGMVFQDYGLFPWLTVRQNIGFGPAARGRPRAEVAATAARFLEMVGLTRFADAYPHQLSGGMKQRVAIARVLANQAEVVLMDEPFGALDAMTRENLQQELLQIWESAGLTIIFVTHAIEEAILLADRVVVMSPGPGRIVADERVPLPRPRDPTGVEFNALRRHLAALLGSQH